MIIAAALTLVSLPARAAVMVPPPVPSSLWTRSLSQVQSAVAQSKPAYVPVDVSIDRFVPDRALVSDPHLGLDLEVGRLGLGSLDLSGYLSGSGMLRAPRSSWEGVDLMGDGFNVGVAPFGSMRFLINGPYKKDDGSDGSLSVGIDADGLPLRDLEIHQPGLDLVARWRSDGYELKGRADSRLYGKRALAIVSAAIASLTFDSFLP